MENSAGTDFANLKDWVGTTESASDVATAWPAAALAATLDRSDPAPVPGDALPPGWHWLYFLEAPSASGLGPDGHPKRGGFLPPVALPRRMWAGGRIEFSAPLRVGNALRRDSEVISIEAKKGRSGHLVFVTVRHTVHANGRLALTEEHDIVYREAAVPNERPAQSVPAPRAAVWQRELTADTVLLFRMSALIFNAHRIHFDLDFVREAGYPGLLVHGPLQTLLLLDLCRRNDPRPVTRLDYRAAHPVFHDERMTVGGNPSPAASSVDLWTANSAGQLAMTGTATLG